MNHDKKSPAPKKSLTLADLGTVVGGLRPTETTINVRGTDPATGGTTETPGDIRSPF
jgi:hypothetical protein